jgi:uncharacterized protein (TIGR00661 family)
MLNSKGLKILVAPLDWGLGHATRCIPIIKELINRGHEVVLATSGKQKILLQEEFPTLQFIDLRGYMVRYGSQKRLSLLKILIQIPKILIQIKREKRWLTNYLRSNKLDLLISDNRFGLSAPGLCSVFITHQLHIRSPFGKISSRVLTAVNYKFINHFSICWVPDFNNAYSLSGKLSHPEILPVIPIRYIGPLTRFATSGISIDTDLLMIIISGPEPQRSLFEKKLFAQLKNYEGKAIVVRGLPGIYEIPEIPSNIVVYNHLPAISLNKLINESEFVISRSGYSTIMDLLTLGKKGILIPTPGQPEQEYLAEYLFEKKMIFSVKEKDFVLQTCLEAAKKFPFVKLTQKDSLLSEAIDELNTIIE